MGVVVKFEGMSEVMQMFDAAPAELMKAARKAAKKGGSAAQRSIRPKIPARWRKLMRNKVKRAGDIITDIGLYNRKEAFGRQPVSGKEIHDWFKAYWANYGTLQGRDPMHRFDKPVRPSGSAAGRRRRNNVGQMHQNFFESALPGWDDAFIDAFHESMKEQGYDISKAL